MRSCVAMLNKQDSISDDTREDEGWAMLAIVELVFQMQGHQLTHSEIKVQEWLISLIKLKDRNIFGYILHGRILEI